MNDMKVEGETLQRWAHAVADNTSQRLKQKLTTISFVIH